MSLVPRFPPYQLMLHNDREQQGWLKAVKQYPVLRDVATHSRGRFARHFVDKIVECVIRDCSVNLCDLMDEACAAVSLRTHEGKKFLHSHDGKKAQLMAISYTNGAGEPPRKKRRHEVGAFGMHLHFANLVDEQLTDMTVSNGTLETSSGTWTPTCCFSAIDEDMLLYLAILGGKKFPSYYDHKTREKYSTKYIFKATEIFSVHENTNAVSHDYKAFENMVAHAIFCSSRRNGVRGIPFNESFACLLGEFQDKLWKMMSMYVRKGRRIVASDLLDDCSADVQRLSSTIIPFLAPPNAEWPVWILDQNSYGCNFGHLVRASNEERCDVYVRDAENKNEKPIFICECKYWEKNVDMSVMDKIIDGLNQKWNWEIVFVFCMKLASFRKPWGHPTVGCVKINYRDGGVKWIFQPPEKKDRKQLIVCRNHRLGNKK